MQFCWTSPARVTPLTLQRRISGSRHRRSSCSRSAVRMALNVVKLKELGYSGHIYQFGPGTKFGWHTHACDKKDAIITGRFMLKSRDQELVKQVILGPGDMLDIPKGMEHYAETVGREVVTFVDSTRC